MHAAHRHDRHPRLSRPVTAAVALSTLFACALSPTAEHRGPTVRAVHATQGTPQEHDAALLPEDWDTCSPHRFERWIDTTFPSTDARDSGAATPAFSTLESATLRDALDTPGMRAVRAAVALGRCASQEALSALEARLTARVPQPERTADAADVVAARALARTLHHADVPREERRSRIAALEALSIGSQPHPDFEVRVEAAVGVLPFRARAVGPLLLRVLRVGLGNEESDAELGAPRTSAWGRGRAASALARLLNCTNPYRTDASFAARERATQLLEEHFQAQFGDAKESRGR